MSNETSSVINLDVDAKLGVIGFDDGKHAIIELHDRPSGARLLVTWPVSGSPDHADVQLATVAGLIDNLPEIIFDALENTEDASCDCGECDEESIKDSVRGLIGGLA